MRSIQAQKWRNILNVKEVLNKFRSRKGNFHPRNRFKVFFFELLVDFEMLFKLLSKSLIMVCHCY